MNEETSSVTISPDCPHRQELEHTLLQCQTQSEILQATRDNYLSIIDEFKRDLEELTEQVEQQHHQAQIPPCPEPELHIEAPPRINCELEIQNERLVCQIKSLTDTLKNRNELINKLQTMINSYSDMSENSRLKEENHELKMKNSENARKTREIAEQLNGQVTQRVELINKYESLSASFEEQCQELKGANRRVQSLQARLCQVEKLQEELKTERKMLREEVIALKEKDACSTGRERALQDQLRCSQIDLDKSRCLIRNMQSQLQQQELLHQESIQDLKQANESIREQVRGMGAECQQMQQRLKQEADVNRQQKQIIDTFRKWKDAQVRADDVMRERNNRAEEHINMLLEENQSLAEEYRLLVRDHTVLETEMDRVKQAVNYSSSSKFECPPGMERIEGGNDMARRLRSMNDTSQRISDQCKTLNTNTDKTAQITDKTTRAQGGAGKRDSLNAQRPSRFSNNLFL
ncbi:myosin heavy chain, clone 203 isoform X4 [Drosophila bipectinata]|uniref:myosin heavy chain, clone 203 isoform X4 n=1 Tax=Drosophila bipectinata TaxID=42026 RepID=UPI0038B3743C